MLGYKPWRFASRQLVQAKKAIDLRDALHNAESGIESIGSAAKRTYNDIAEEVDDDFESWVKRGKRAGEMGLEALDTPSKYVGKPAVAALTGGLTSDRHMGEDGRYYRDPGGWGDLLPTLGKIATQDPVDSYQQLREASDERWRNPKLQEDIAGRIALAAVSDPTSYVPVGGAAKILPAGIREARAAKIATELIETPRAAVAGGVAGATAGGYAAEKLGAPEWVGELAGGLAGGGLAVNARRARAAAGGGVMNAVQEPHPHVEADLSDADAAMARQMADPEARKALEKRLREPVEAPRSPLLDKPVALKGHPIQFDSDTEKALYMLTETPVSKRDVRIEELGLSRAFPDASTEDLITRGRRLRAQLNAQAKTAASGATLRGFEHEPTEFTKGNVRPSIAAERRANSTANRYAKQAAEETDPAKQAVYEARSEAARDLSQRAGMIGPPAYQRAGMAEPVENGADLLQLPDRETAIAGKAQYLESRKGRVDTKIRAATAKLLGPVLKAGGGEGRGANIVQDAQITPIWEGINQAENQREHLKAVIEDRLHALAGSGIRIVQREDGNWVEAKSGLPWSDIVEHDTAAGKAAWDALTPDQRQLTTELTDFYDRATQTATKYGGDISLIQHEGEHWPRKVVSIDGEEKVSGFGSGRRFAKQGIQKARTVANAADAMDNRSIVYDHPFDAYASGFDQKLRIGTDAWVKGMVEPLATTEGHQMTTVGIDGLKDMRFEPDVAKRLQAGLTKPNPGALEAGIRGLNAIATPIRATMDISATFQQGMNAWLQNPKAAAANWLTTIRSLKNPEVYQASRQSLDQQIGALLDQAGIKHNGGIEYAATHGLRQTAEGAEHEFSFPKMSSKLGVAKKGYDKVTEPFEQHFDRFLNLSRLELFKTQLEKQVGKGLTGDALEKEMRKSSMAVNRSFGWSDKKPTSIESMGFFAPRFLRSNLEELAKAVTDGSIEGDIARRHLGTYLGAAAAITFAVNEARGYETEIRPWKSNFLSIRNAGGVDVSLLGPFDTLLRYGSQAGAQVAQGEAPSALLKLGESKLSPVAGNVVTQIRGSTYMGEPLDGKLDRTMAVLKNLLPFGAQNVVEQGIENGSPKDALVSGAVGFVGLKNNPVTPNEKVDFLREGHEGYLGVNGDPGVAREQFGTDYASLPGSAAPGEPSKAAVNQDPRIQRWQAEADRRASKQDTERGEKAKTDQWVRDQLTASEKFLADGRDSAGNPYGGDQFRQSYNRTMQERAGAYRNIALQKGEDDVAQWFGLYDEARMANGDYDYALLDQKQAEFIAAHPDIQEKADKVTGIRDTPAMQQLRAARKQASEYYSISAYRGMDAADGQLASQYLSIANDMVSYGRARDRDQALRMLARAGYTDGVKAARRAIRLGPNRKRAAYRKSHELFARFYSDADLIPTG